jgi:hypothetical protein
MKISSSNITLSSAHELRQSQSQKESLQVWTGARPTDTPTDTASFGSPQLTQAALASRKLNSSQASSAHAKNSVKGANGTDDDASLDASTLVLKRLIKKMFGGKFRALSLPKSDNTDAPPPAASTPSAAAPASASQGWGMEYTSDQVSMEAEQLQFNAAGVIKTADGQDISFSLALQVQRVNVQEQHLDIKAGDAQVDPLVLNYDGSAAQLSSGTFKFDLQANGQSKDLPLLGSASAFLALDRNHDGQINNGRELFGPASGQGFSELDKLDSDQNGWIDENDPAYADLRLWQPAADGKGSLATLAEKNVGAIYLDSVSTPFTYKDDAGQTQATTSATSVFLQENGTAGTIQELNYLA